MNNADSAALEKIEEAILAGLDQVNRDSYHWQKNDQVQHTGLDFEIEVKPSKVGAASFSVLCSTSEIHLAVEDIYYPELIYANKGFTADDLGYLTDLVRVVAKGRFKKFQQKFGSPFGRFYGVKGTIPVIKVISLFTPVAFLLRLLRLNKAIQIDYEAY